jgi:hypothetical protein
MFNLIMPWAWFKVFVKNINKEINNLTWIYIVGFDLINLIQV